MMPEIQLNFLAVDSADFEFVVYKKLSDQSKITDRSIYAYNLPSEDETYKKHFVSFTPREGFKQFICDSETNNFLTTKFIGHLLQERLKILGNQLNYIIDDSRFDASVDFILSEYKQGKEVVSLQPYYLRSAKKFGVLLNFHFNKNPGVPFDREVQRLSLSLDKSYKSNARYYTDKYHVLQDFIERELALIFPLEGNGKELDVKRSFEPLSSSSLDKKVYIFKNEQRHASQFMGLKQYGPYVPVTSTVRYVFIFEKRFRDFANDLYLGLLGKKFGGIFPGIKDLFGINFQKLDVSHIPIANYSRESLEQVFEQIKEISVKAREEKLIGVFITPQEEIKLDEETTAYYYMKHLFASKGLPLQVVNYSHMGNYNTLKWSLANIGLQMFCKLGGIPWKVQPSNERCLIFGLGSAHRADREGIIQKYFGYSVCLDSSGVFQKVNVLAYHQDKATYLNTLREELTRTIMSDVSGSYKKCVLHLPFKIQKAEIEAIRAAIKMVRSQTSVEFRVIKVNTENKFFGFSNHNTRIPYESSYVRLSYDQYLCWFEGLQYGKENVFKKVGSPVHIEFMREANETDSQDKSFLQDVINLSGANWRGFNSKLVPISIYYAALIARYAKEFEEIDNLEAVKQEISSIKYPWFL